MTETVVTYTTRDGPVELPVRFLGRDQNFVLQTEQISHRLSENIPPRLIDLLEVAAAVFCADSSVSRGGLSQPNTGRTWRRKLAFDFAVRDLPFWENSDMSRLLRETIEFLTDDDIECRFRKSEQPSPIHAYLKFKDQAEDAFRIDDVILFSGGIDSLAGALQTLAGTDRRVALVTHRSAPKTIKHQDQLILKLRKEYKDRFLWVPVLVHRKKKRSSESTQRSRSFLFSALGCVVARMLGTARIQFFENGIVSQNLPLARAIVGTLATRTTHPQTLKLLEAVLSRVSSTPISVENGFEWMTKTEVVGLLKTHGHPDLLPLTVSCNHTYRRKSSVRHCGACTQCLDRRFAVLANGMGSRESKEDYAVDVLFGTRERDDRRALAVEWIRHARRLSEMTPSEFQNRFMDDLLRVAQPYLNKQAAFDRCHEMHRRHGTTVAGVLATLTDAEIASASEGSIAASFGKTSPQPATEFGGTFPEPGPRQSAPRPEPPSISPKSDHVVLEVMRTDPNTVAIIGLQDFTGVHARLISLLLDVYLEDRNRGLLLAQYQCLKAREIADSLGVSEDYVRTEVLRIRNGLRESWVSIFESEPPAQILIKTVGKRGYRLDTGINVVSPVQLH